jgi:putative aminopeptidase FrvX
VKDLIRKLVEAWGPSGYEHHVRALIQEEVAALADEIHVDPLGNLICRVGSGGTKIMVAAHMDEIGLMATFVEPTSGYLRFSGIGGLNMTTLFGNRVQFEDGTIGVIGAHDSWNAQDAVDQFYIDISTGDDTSPVEEGSPAVLWRTMQERGTRLIAKAMDDRIGCAVAIEAMRRLNKHTPNEVCFAFTVQEEVGLRGARTAAYGINPDIGIALDVTGTGDEIKNRRMAVKLGDRPCRSRWHPLPARTAHRRYHRCRCDPDHPGRCAQRLHLHSLPLYPHHQRNRRYPRCPGVC